jgi:uncharacterized protein YqjF (DUF2071 family)
MACCNLRGLPMAYPAFARSDHRPFPMPTRRWSWRQRWLDLLFAHWPVPKEQLQALVPSELEVQEFDGTSWIGVVPFRMEDVMLRPLPALPGISAFPELNVRIYVEHQGVPGVWFFSLDASNWLAVRAARTFFTCPISTPACAVTPMAKASTMSRLAASSRAGSPFEHAIDRSRACTTPSPGRSSIG